MVFLLYTGIMRSLIHENWESNITSRVPAHRAPLSDEGHFSIGVYLSLLGAVAFVGNVTVLLVILSRRSAFQKMQNALLINLAVADLLVTLTGYPLTAVSSFYKRWLFGDLACQVGGFLVFMLTMVSLDTLCFIAVFRYILVCRPKYHHLLRMESARTVVVICWVHAVVWTALPMLGWSRYVPEPFSTACSIDWSTPTFLNFTYVLLTIVTCYVLHVTVVLFCYISIMKKSRKLTFGTRKNSSLVNLEEVLWHHKVETERGVTKMCVVMITAFLVCWSPYAFISMLPMCGVQLDTPVATLPTMFAKLSCALNPIIYAFMSSKFRQGLISLIPRARRNQTCVATTTAAIELPETAPFKAIQHREPVLVREYRGDMTNQGVYIGNLAVTLEVQSSVF